MSDTDIRSMEITELRRGYAEGGVRVRDVVERVLERIDRRGADNVWISRWPDDVLRQRADELDRSGERDRLPLFGVPVAVKDVIDVDGLPTTAGCPAYAYHPASDAGSVRRLLDAGAIVVGKTNLDQFATGLTGTRSPYGACESVFGGGMVSGGSSSGSAVAVAAGLVSVALGTDTAGSGRVPAALNGIVGLKPTRGLVGASGVVPACRSLDCVSVFTVTTVDAALVLDVLAGPDPGDPWSRRPPASASAPGSPRIALPADADLNYEGDEAMRAAFAAATREIRVGGAAVPTELAPLLEAGDLLYRGPWVAERLAQFEGFLTDHPDDVLPVTRQIISSAGRYSAVDAFRALYRLQELRVWTDGLWQRADMLLLPTVPTTFTVAEIAEQPVERNLVLGRYTQFANLLDLAVVTVPAGLTADGRPASMSLIGPAFSEPMLLAASAHLAR